MALNLIEQTRSTGFGPDVTATLSATPGPGDFLVAIVAHRQGSSSEDYTFPGFSLAAEANTAQWADHIVFTKVADGSESSVTMTKEDDTGQTGFFLYHFSAPVTGVVRLSTEAAFDAAGGNETDGYFKTITDLLSNSGDVIIAMAIANGNGTFDSAVWTPTADAVESGGTSNRGHSQAVFTSTGSDTITVDNAATDERFGMYAVVFEEDTSPQLELDETVRYGSTISGTYNLFASNPTGPVNITDSQDNTFTVEVTYTHNGDGTGSFTGTMPSIPSSGTSAQLGLTGLATASIDTATTEFMLSVPTTWGSTTLASGFNMYLWEDWALADQPVAGDQILMLSTAGSIDSNGDLVTDVESTTLESAIIRQSGLTESYYVDSTGLDDVNTGGTTTDSPFRIRLKDLSSARANPFDQPFFTTGSSGRNGVRGGFPQPPTSGDQLPFFEDFNSQPDWTSGMPENNTGAFPVNGEGPDRSQRQGTHTVPKNWYSARQDPSWAPSVGHSDRHESIEILESNSEKARNGNGKSYVSWRDSGGSSWRWNSDSQLTKYLPGGFDQIYVEFWIAFSPDWTINTNSDTSKLFRITSWSEEGSEFQAFSGGNQGPLFIWNWKHDNYGVRNVFTLRGGPHGDNYTMTDDEKGNHPRGSMNFAEDTVGMGVAGTTPQITDKVNGGFISDNLSQIVTHKQIFGEGGQYTKLGFFVKMNSAIGINDGVLRQWLDDVQIYNNETVAWQTPAEGVDDMVKWNLISLGGNDFFHSYPDEDRREEWYSIDDVFIDNNIPEGKK